MTSFKIPWALVLFLALFGVLPSCKTPVGDTEESSQSLAGQVAEARAEGDPGKAIELWYSVLEKDPDNHQTRLALAKVLGDFLRPGEGLDILDSGTLPQDPDLARSWIETIANLAGQAGKDGRAIEAHNDLIEKGWATWRNHAALGGIYRRAGQFAEALPFYQRALAANPGNGGIRIARVLCLIRIGNDQAARDALIEDLQRFPKHPTVTRIACRLLAASQDENVRKPTVAIHLIEQLEHVPETAEWTETQAMVSASSGDFETAVAFQQKALRLARSIEQSDLAKALLDDLQSYAERRFPKVAFRPEDPIFYAVSYDGLFNGRASRGGGETVPELLRKIAKTADPATNSFLNAQKVTGLAAQLAVSKDVNKRLALLPAYAQELLRAGETEKALSVYEALEGILKSQNTELNVAQKQWLWDQFGVANLRLAEQENCLNQHQAEACILPLKGGGLHQSKTGSLAARAYFQKVLELLPENPRARWLDLVAAMTLGKTPETIPAPLEKAQISDEPGHGSMPFTNVAHEWGVAVMGLSGGTIVEDFDNDGLLDIVVSSWGLTDQIRYFRNTGMGFEDQTATAGLLGQWSGLNMIQTDYNNDGFADVFVLRGAWLGAAGQHPNSLLRNNGDGTFTDVTTDVGLLSFRPAQTAVWQDFDGDGWLDLFIGNESSGPDRFPCELYRNLGNGRFEEIGAQVGLALEVFAKGVTAGDVDGDGRPDLYLSIYGGKNHLLLNKPSDGRPGFGFVDVTEAAGVAGPDDSFPTWFWDFNNDGWLDLFVSDYTSRDLDRVYAELLGQSGKGETSRLYRNRGDGTFDDVTEAMGMNHLLVGMGANFGDLNNDGFLDAYVGNGTPDLGVLIPNRVFQNHNGERMEDITLTSGLAHLQKGHGVAFGDFDNDGDQDIYITLGGAYQGDVYPNALFRNNLANPQTWVKLELSGRTANRKGIGARIEIKGNTQNGPVKRYRTVGSGGSFGASPLRQEIGLGAVVGNLEITVTWPGSRKEDVFKGVAPNAAYRVVEGEKALFRIELPEFVPPHSQNMNHGRH